MSGTPSQRRRAGHVPSQPVKRKIARRIYERDGYVCQLCGLPVDAGLIGSNEDGAPSLDHIVSFADGGRFQAENLRLAHRGCNQDRHAEPKLGEERRAA